MVVREAKVGAFGREAVAKRRRMETSDLAHGHASGGESRPKSVHRRADGRHGAHAGDQDSPPTVVHLVASVHPGASPRGQPPFDGRSTSRLIPASVRDAIPWMNTGPITSVAASGPTSGHAGPPHS